MGVALQHRVIEADIIELLGLLILNVFLFLFLFYFRVIGLVNLIVLDVEQHRIGNSKRQLRVLHRLKIHLETFQLNQ